ncbi:SCO family protein [Plastorhodobacter daqingensis]|uniref:SCO family protein n=1 Tax=Plastorhodobacter daqingensis TaxID=1387281 RepID=A0ABW2UGI7_9RHOB
MTRLYAGIAAAAVAAVLGALGVVVLMRGQDEAFAQCRATNVAGGTAAIGGPFELVDQTGRTVTDADVFTKPALVYFGYTFCPDVCPLDSARNAEAVDLLEEMGYEVTPVFISVDPQRDTPEVLADYAELFHPRMIALTGSPEQVQAASQAYRTYYRIHESDDEFYLVDHSTFTYLVLPEVGFVEFFRRESSAEEMAEATSCFLRAAS